MERRATNMKLYATTTSERATKGQGGDFLHITITDKNKEELWRLYVENKDGKTHISLWEMDQCVYAGNSIKGKKQKGENTVSFHCAGCNIDEDWTAKDIAEKGTPVCPKCDEDMTA